MKSLGERKEKMRQRTKALPVWWFASMSAWANKRKSCGYWARQLPRFGTSVAANYREASRACSSDEFIAKVETCIKEADKSQLWPKLLRDDCGIASPDLAEIWRESNELVAIFVTMSTRVKNR